MNLFIPKECDQETRVAVVPETVKKFVDLGITVFVEEGLGKHIFIDDIAYKQSGANIVSKAGCTDVLKTADIILHVLPICKDYIKQLKPDAWHISFFDSFNYKDEYEQFKEQKVNLISLERIPRTSFSQKMDALSSQSNLAGYIGVLNGINYSNKVMPMMVTSAGTLQAARVFIIGAGVAGLQAIATAKRLGAVVEAFDTRAEVEEQVKSVGAKFIKIDLGQTESNNQGYAKELTEAQLDKQKKFMLNTCAHSDIVITTAKVFGRQAPIIITKEILASMKPGSVVVDLAVESGGNTEDLIKGKNVQTENGVWILGEGYAERKVASSASKMLSANLYALIDYLFDKTQNKIMRNYEDPILKNCLILNCQKLNFCS